MKTCGACETELPKESFSGKQWRLRKSLRRCSECVAAGNELVLFTKGRERSVDDECPICSRLLPLKNNQSMLYTCCMETVCIGCALKHGMIENCPFCRTPLTLDDEAQIARIQKRVKANDPVAIHHLGICYRNGDCGLEKDMSRAVELFERAAVLGLKKAHFDLGYIFDEDTDDKGIAKDMSRASELYEIAAKQGHVLARFSLGIIDLKSGKYGLALKHWIISAKLGCPASLGAIKDLFREGLASKSDYAEAMRGYHDAVKEMSSPERDEAKAFAEAGGHG